MRGIWNHRLGLSIFGESHGEGVGVVLSGLPAGIALDEAAIATEMVRRAPGKNRLSTPRQEADRVRILSGFYQGHTSGAPLCGFIENQNTRSADYEKLQRLMRPGHADYPASVKYRGFADPRGGGHFSGRLTAPLVFAGAIARQILASRGIEVAAHIGRVADVQDLRFDPVSVDEAQLRGLREKSFPVLDAAVEAVMGETILAAKTEGDSVGGSIECAAVGLPVGLGEPFFGSVESVLSSLLFSIPAVKAVSFGAGEAFAGMRGSQANDPYRMKAGTIVTESNHNGGVLGGLTTGMPLVLSVIVKPTPSIAKPQRTVDIQSRADTALEIKGRHDPCIVPRAVPVVEAAVMLGLLSLVLEEKYDGA